MQENWQWWCHRQPLENGKGWHIDVTLMNGQCISSLRVWLWNRDCSTHFRPEHYNNVSSKTSFLGMGWPHTILWQGGKRTADHPTVKTPCPWELLRWTRSNRSSAFSLRYKGVCSRKIGPWEGHPWRESSFGNNRWLPQLPSWFLLDAQGLELMFSYLSVTFYLFFYLLYI